MPKVKPKMRAYPIISDAVEAGVTFGWRRFWKHRDPPEGFNPEAYLMDLQEQMHMAVMGELCEVIDFDRC